jgi:beta-carotene 3-hydroxylase
VIPFVIATVSLLAMEPAVTAVHRWVMHRGGWGWHRSHHLRAEGALEANDLFPVVFAAVTIAVMALGAAVEPLAPLLWIGCGVTAYGAAYLVVHDVYIHERLGRPPGAGSSAVRWLADAHRIHHQFGRAPYGFLLPVVPHDLRERARGRAGGRDVLSRAAPEGGPATVGTLVVSPTGRAEHHRPTPR